ncbi:MAG TPA: wax ester/triacylglycerol synthase family O-acyltransferase [Candidatus Dormibacteraeota bacterium]|jgi:WS/DGAT/MGAT family acyltransferase|nr:wax ester/triacylglycerol synthase family O-acyltransferase [Candidatus Dormibacteraeota bacterium]
MKGAQKLSALDASFLHLETPNTHMHIGGVAVFEPSPLGGGETLYRALVRAIEPRLDLMPRYRQKLAFVPLSLDVPVWVEDEDFDITQHVRRAALPAPGGDAELTDFVARVFGRQLDRRRPLWELYIVEGLKDGRWALLTKTHHAMVDGISNLELATILLDTEREPSPLPGAAMSRRASGDPAPSPFDLLIDSLRRRVGRPVRAVSAARAVAERPRRLAAALRDTAEGLVAMVPAMRAPRGVLNGKTGPSRVYVISRFPLSDFRAVKGAMGGTINDVVLAVVTGGLRRFMMARGVDVGEETATALCPVSIRDDTERTALGNRLAMLLVRLPVDEPDPAYRMAAVRATVDRLKARKQAVGADFLLSLAGFAPATLHAMVSRASLRQIGFNLVVTNVPGPQFPLYCQGAQLVEAFPVAFLYAGQYVAIAIFSYNGQLNFGYLADAKGMSDVDLLASGVEESVRELVALATENVPQKATTRTRAAAARKTATRTAARKVASRR